MKKHFVCVKPTRCQVSGNNPKKPKGETVIFVNKIMNCQLLEREKMSTKVCSECCLLIQDKVIQATTPAIYL